MTLEHIIPKGRGGQDNEENLWLSCRLCNEVKGILVDAVDPETGVRVPLYNPRSQAWTDHFAWSDDGTRILGRTAVGRATVAALDLNDNLRVRARAIWVEAGYHLPSR